MWEYELYMNALNDMIKEENENQQKEMDQYKVNDYKNLANPKNVSKMMQNPTSQLPKMQNMKNLK